LEVQTHETKSTQTKAPRKKSSREEAILRIKNGVTGNREIVVAPKVLILSRIEQQTHHDQHNNRKTGKQEIAE
jgi:hypothetical protein